MSATPDALLSVRNLSVPFGGIVALDGISVEVRRGQICRVIGPYGPRQTTRSERLDRP